MTRPDEHRADSVLTAAERSRLDAIRGAASLAELQTIIDAPSEHAAYLKAREEWQTLQQKELGKPDFTDELPGDTVVVDGQAFVVHGITHSNTDEERAFLREHVNAFLARGESVYCEQGIRRMYFQELDEVCEIDDYRWAMHRCRNSDIDTRLAEFIEDDFREGFSADITSIASRFREAVYALIESGSDVYGERFASALGDVASDFLMRHEQVGTLDDFESFRQSRRASVDPEQLGALQHYYKQVFLPQPLEREWLRRHDRELELFTHARNERIAAYTLYHGADTDPVHLVVGAAHQPGVAYYLEEYRDGEWTPEEFELVP